MEESTKAIADWVVQMRYEDLPASVIEAMKVFITDHFGCVIGGTVKESSRIITEVTTAWGPANGTCTLVGRSMRTSAPMAALVNGTSGHALELDDDHREGTQHTGVAVLPAAFAVGEQEGKSGRDFLLAAVLGYEIMVRLGEAHLGKSYLHGFHPTGTCGSIGAAVAVGKLLELNTEQMTAAMGMGASQSAGLLTFRSNGAWSKRFHAGHASMAGVLSSYLVRKGYRGPSECLFGPEGWLQAFAYNDEYDADRLFGGLGEKWDLLDNSIKVHACCRFAGPIVDATLEVVHRENLKPAQVAEVVVAMAKYPLTRSLTEPRERKFNPTSVVDAQFSAPFAAAVAIVKQRAFVEEYSETGIRDPEVLKMARLVRWEVDPEAERLWPTRYPCEVRIRRTDGTVVSSRVEWPKGDPENPVSQTELENKFRALSEPVLGTEGINNLLEVLGSLHELESLQRLSSALSYKLN